MLIMVDLLFVVIQLRIGEEILFLNTKAGRKTKRENDTTDWNSLFNFLHEMIDDLRILSIQGNES